MVAETAVKVAPGARKEDLSWLFEAPRLSHCPIPGRPGWHWCKGTETIYEVSDGQGEPAACECPRWRLGKKVCAHIKAVRRPNPGDVCGTCPLCGDELVTEVLYVEQKGYRVRLACWSTKGEVPECDYVRSV